MSEKKEKSHLLRDVGIGSGAGTIAAAAAAALLMRGRKLPIGSNTLVGHVGGTPGAYKQSVAHMKPMSPSVHATVSDAEYAAVPKKWTQDVGPLPFVAPKHGPESPAGVAKQHVRESIYAAEPKGGSGATKLLGYNQPKPAAAAPKPHPVKDFDLKKAQKQANNTINKIFKSMYNV